MERRLSAILAADVVGYSKLMEADESGTLEVLKRLRTEVFNPTIDTHHGRIVKLMGDGVLVEFPSVVDAVQAAVAIQGTLAGDPSGIAVRIGINLGDIIIEDDDIYGDGVNIAARLETAAEAGGISISSIVHESIGNRVEATFVDAGEHRFKNIDRPIRVFNWQADKSLKAQATVALALPDKPSIVVLPFDNMSGDPAQEYFADGMVEAITAALANIRAFFVIARNTAFTYKNKAVSVPDIGRELGVGYVLEGSVQRASQRIRITAQLIETTNGTHVWAKRFDGVSDDIFDLQDQITEQVAGALQPSIRLAEIERVKRKPPQDLGAYDLTMQALTHVWTLEKDKTTAGLEFLERALKMDPDYPMALSLAAWCHAQRSVYNWTDDLVESRRLALTLAERAADQNGSDPLVLAVLGTVHTVSRNFGTARILLERAVSIDPNDAWAWSRLAWLSAYADRPDVALQHFEKARRLSPFDPLIFNMYVGMACSHEILGDYDTAISYFRRALEERPNAAWIYRSLAPVLVSAGRIEEAQAAFDALMESYPNLTGEQVRQAMAFSESYMNRMIGNLVKLGLPE